MRVLVKFIIAALFIILAFSLCVCRLGCFRDGTFSFDASLSNTITSSITSDIGAAIAARQPHRRLFHPVSRIYLPVPAHARAGCAYRRWRADDNIVALSSAGTRFLRQHAPKPIDDAGD